MLLKRVLQKQSRLNIQGIVANFKACGIERGKAYQHEHEMHKIVSLPITQEHSNVFRTTLVLLQ